MSDPGSPDYRRFLGVEELARRYGAPRGDRRAVTAFLRRAGARARTDATRSFVTTRVGARAAERVLGAPLALYSSPTGEPFPGVTAPARIARPLRGRVSAALGLEPPVPAGSPSAVAQGERPERTGTPAGCAEGVATGGFTPNQILSAYGIGPLHERGIRGNGARLALLEGDDFWQPDLDTWTACFGIEPPPIRLTDVPGTTTVDAGGESELDAEIVAAVAPGLRELQIYQGGTELWQFPALFAAPLDERTNGGRLPDVVVRSYGGCEPAWSGAQPGAVALMEHILMTAAAAGITVVASAGDRGSSDCQEADGAIVPELAVRYPASSPHVIAAGGTTMTLAADNSIASQAAWNDLPFGYERGGGGGASALFERPGWQRAAGLSGGARLVPDLSAFADTSIGYAVFCTTACPSPGWHVAAGTSAAAPLVGASVALAGQVAGRSGKRRFGALGPRLYELARERRAAVADVVAGDNDLFGLGCCAAAPGYDRATGLGTPVVQRIVQGLAESP